MMNYKARVTAKIQQEKGKNKLTNGPEKYVNNNEKQLKPALFFFGIFNWLD